MNSVAKIIGLVIVVSSLMSCGVKTSSTNDNSEIAKEQINDTIKITEEETQAMDRVFDLPEMQSIKNIKGIELFSNGTYDINNNTYYYIQVMRDMETHYYTMYHFFIPEKSKMEIKILDTLNDTIISLEQWRKNKYK